jgi:hypothetical protein
MVGLGRGLTVIEVEAVAEHAVTEFVTVTSYAVVDDGETTLLFPLALIGAAQEYVIPVVGLAVSVTDAPVQIIPSLLAVPEVSAILIVGDGKEFTVTDAATDAAQLVVAFVTVTVYAVVETGETALLFPLALIGAAHE